MIPEHIAIMARDCLMVAGCRVIDARYPQSQSPSATREVIADWCETVGRKTEAVFLRPKPIGREWSTWETGRKAVLEFFAASVALTKRISTMEVQVLVRYVRMDDVYLGGFDKYDKPQWVPRSEAQPYATKQRAHAARFDALCYEGERAEIYVVRIRPKVSSSRGVDS